MSSVWAPVVAALGASALTGFLTFGVQFWERHRQAKAMRAAARRAIYLRLLTVTGTMMTEFGALQVLNGAMSKWFHGLNQLLKAAPAQPTMMELMERFAGPMRQLADVWSEAWLLFDAEEITAVNRLVNAVDNIDLSLPVTDEKSVVFVLGKARREFAEFARTRIGEAAISLADTIPGVAAAPESAPKE